MRNLDETKRFLREADGKLDQAIYVRIEPAPPSWTVILKIWAAETVSAFCGMGGSL